MGPERKEPDIIKIIELAPGFTFEDITAADWEEETPVREYNATVAVRVLDTENMLMRCERAWLRERGLFLEYPGFKEGLLRRVRITDCIDDSYEDEQQIYPAVRFRVVLTQEDFDDFAANLGQFEEDE